MSKLVYLYLQMAVKILDATEEDTLEFDIAATDIAVYLTISSIKFETCLVWLHKYGRNASISNHLEIDAIAKMAEIKNPVTER